MQANLKSCREQLEQGTEHPISEENWGVVEKKFEEETNFDSEVVVKKGVHVVSRLVKALDDNKRATASRLHCAKTLPSTSVEVIQDGKVRRFGDMDSKQEAIILISNKAAVWEIYLFQP